LLTEIRSTARSRHREPVIHAVPSAIIASSTRLVRSSSPKDTHTWVNTTSLSTSAPGIAAAPSAKARACRQSRSTSSATPERPSARSTAHTGSARPRREISGTLSSGSPCSS
jgi:hypothetical protein